jgi:hypothetical protein
MTTAMVMTISEGLLERLLKLYREPGIPPREAMGMDRRLSALCEITTIAIAPEITTIARCDGSARRVRLATEVDPGLAFLSAPIRSNSALRRPVCDSKAKQA